jgi:hypothetical protein
VEEEVQKGERAVAGLFLESRYVFLELRLKPDEPWAIAAA